MSLIMNIAREDFLSGLASLQNVTGKKGTIAILSNVLIQSDTDSIIITGTDLEVGIKVSLPAEILSAGAITLPSKKLFEIIRESNSDTIHLEERENKWAKITAQASDYNLAGMADEEFPTFPEYEEQSLLELPSELFKDLIDKTIFSVAQEGESQFNLTGLLIEKDTKDEKQYLRMVSSDGHRLSIMEREVEKDISGLNLEKTTLVPRKGIQEIRKFCENHNVIKLGFEEKQAVIKSDNSILIIRLMNGDFPDYRNIITVITKENNMEIDRISFLNSMKRMNLFTEDRHNAVHFNIDKDIIILSSQNMDIGNAKDELAIKYEGKPFQLGFNGRYFVDALQVLNSEIIHAYINSEESPCLIQADDEPGFLGIIMPMKI